MPFSVSAVGDTSRSISAVVTKIDADGSLGDTWDENASDWAASPTDSNARIAMTEGSNQYAGHYFANKASLGSDSSDILVRFIDHTSTAVCVGQQITHLTDGEVDITATTDISAATVADGRVFYFYPSRNKTTAYNALSTARFKVPANINATFAFDFDQALNENTDLLGVTSVTDNGANSGAITISNALVNQTRRQAHVDLSGMTATNTHDLECKVTTTDGQTLICYAYIEAE